MICHARCPDGILVRFRCLIVENLVFWVDALSLHSGEGPVAGEYEFTASLIFHWFCPRQVAVNVMEDHDVLVAFAQHRGELSSLI